MGNKIATIAMKPPNIPIASGEYKRVTIGDASKDINCAPAVPLLTMRIFLNSLFCFKESIKGSKILGYLFMN